jgi:hypothetical protein
MAAPLLSTPARLTHTGRRQHGGSPRRRAVFVEPFEMALAKGIPQALAHITITRVPTRTRS